jgi:hypothetical protein
MALFTTTGGKAYTRKTEHIKKSHRHEASKQFISLYINKMNKTCQVCQSIKPFKESLKLHVSREQLGRATKESAPTFNLIVFSDFNWTKIFT